MDRRQREKQAKKAEAIKRARQAEANRAGAGIKRQFEKVEAAKKSVPRNSEPVKKKRKRKTSKKQSTKAKKQKQPEFDWQKSGMSREEYRRAEREQREKQKGRKKGFIKFLVIVFVLLIGAILSVTVFFKIETINITGLSQYSKEQIEEASGIKTGDNLILIKKDAVADKIGSILPYTGEITIKRVFPSTIEIQVEDTKIESAVKSGGNYYILDGTGKVLKTVHSEKEVYKTVMEQALIAEKKREELKNRKPKEEKKDAEAEKKDAEAEKKDTEAENKDTEAEKKDDEEKIKEKPAPVPEDYKGDVIIISGFKVKKATPGHRIEIEEEDKYGEYEKVLKLLKKQGIKNITGMNFSKKTDIILFYDGRIEIHLGSVNKLEQKLALGSKILREQNKVSQEQKGLIDLTIPGKGYFSEGKPRLPKPEKDDEKTEDSPDEKKDEKAGETVDKTGRKDSKHNN